MRTLTSSGFKLLQRFPAVQSVSFSTLNQFKKQSGFNVLFFCPRNEDHLKKFNGEYPNFIKLMNPESVSITDVAHNPENNSHAVRLFLNNNILPEIIIPHLALIAHSKEDIDQKIRFFDEIGIKSIFAVRGNPAVLEKDKDYIHPEGYKNMAQLIGRIKNLAPHMKVIVTGYPGKHPYAKNLKEDMDELKKKVDYGADMIITQHFFDNDILLGFLNYCQKLKIDIPIMPSILPIGNPKYLFSFSQAANVHIPAEITKILFSGEGMTLQSEKIQDISVRKKAIEYTTKQIQELVDLKLPQVPRINIYAANNIIFLKEIFDGLSMLPETKFKSI